MQLVAVGRMIHAKAVRQEAMLLCSNARKGARKVRMMHVDPGEASEELRSRCVALLSAALVVSGPIGVQSFLH